MTGRSQITAVVARGRGRGKDDRKQNAGPVDYNTSGVVTPALEKGYTEENPGTYPASCFIISVSH
jgi:hypothetical protein